jgi:uncharacterized cupin superfamily protein
MQSMRRVNLLGLALDMERSQPGFSWRATRIGDRLGSERIGATLYELPEGGQSFPYHYHHGVEEWLYVVAGTPTLRTPDGERPLRPGDIVCFPANAGGAHTVAGPGKVLILSANRTPSIAVYPDSDKLGTRPGGADKSDNLNFRRRDAVDYWEGE